MWLEGGGPPLHPHFSPVAGSLPRRHHRRFFAHAWRRIHLSHWIAFAPFAVTQPGQWRNRKNSTGNRASSRSARLHDRVQNRRDSSAAPGFERMFCLLTGVCCYRCAHAKGVLLASRILFSQQQQAWGRAVGHSGNRRNGHGQEPP